MLDFNEAARRMVTQLENYTKHKHPHSFLNSPTSFNVESLCQNRQLHVCLMCTLRGFTGGGGHRLHMLRLSLLPLNVASVA